MMQKRRKTKAPDVEPPVRDRMKKAFNEIYKAVLDCRDETGRKRCELFREVPDRRVRVPIQLNILISSVY